MEIAGRTGADAIAHGATGKGNDQVRFELGAYAFNPDIRIIAPWREWDLHSREQLLAYAAEHGIPIERKSSNASPYSMDANLLHISFEGNELEVPATEPDEGMWWWTRSPEAAPDTPRYVELAYRRGDVVAIDGEAVSPAAAIERLNAIGGEHGVGRIDIVENRYVGMKSRGCYETPGGTIMLRAHRAIESITLDREAAHLKDELMPRYAYIIYNGYWWSPERLMLQALIDESQRHVNGTVRLKLYKGNVLVVGRRSDSDDLFDPAIATFEDDRGAYDQRDAEGFIRLNALRLRTAARAGVRRPSWIGPDGCANAAIVRQATAFSVGRVCRGSLSGPSWPFLERIDHELMIRHWPKSADGGSSPALRTRRRPVSPAGATGASRSGTRARWASFFSHL